MAPLIFDTYTGDNLLYLFYVVLLCAVVYILSYASLFLARFQGYICNAFRCFQAGDAKKDVEASSSVEYFSKNHARMLLIACAMMYGMSHAKIIMFNYSMSYPTST